ncbi:hypothetical protein Cadr_000013948 [Camelus dromedarius]|uniref:Uncharacterized protein n=1 Tax=Camelus dromedarius TaxID=9838 RepID=A0A5N4DDZ0_CAMDR|nr:hypothetical protein Cadr_000013948 [Camelus dromedarius]
MLTVTSVSRTPGKEQTCTTHPPPHPPHKPPPHEPLLRASHRPPPRRGSPHNPRHARSLPPPPASPSVGLARPGSHLPRCGLSPPGRLARLGLQLAPTARTVGPRDFPTARAPTPPPSLSAGLGGVPGAFYSRLFAPPRPQAPPCPAPFSASRSVQASSEFPGAQTSSFSSTIHPSRRPTPDHAPPAQRPFPRQALSVVCLPSPSSAQILGPVRPTRPALERARTRSPHLSELQALHPQVRPRPSCRVSRKRASPAQCYPRPCRPPRSHGARSPPAPSLLPPTFCLTLPSFVPGARSCFPPQPRRGRREPPPRSCCWLPQAGAQVGGGRGPGRSRSPELRVGAGAGFEERVEWGRGRPRGTGCEDEDTGVTEMSLRVELGCWDRVWGVRVGGAGLVWVGLGRGLSGNLRIRRIAVLGRGEREWDLRSVRRKGSRIGTEEGVGFWGGEGRRDRCWWDWIWGSWKDWKGRRLERWGGRGAGSE